MNFSGSLTLPRRVSHELGVVLSFQNFLRKPPTARRTLCWYDINLPDKSSATIPSWLIPPSPEQAKRLGQFLVSFLKLDRQLSRETSLNGFRLRPPAVQAPDVGSDLLQLDCKTSF